MNIFCLRILCVKQASKSFGNGDAEYYKKEYAFRDAVTNL